MTKLASLRFVPFQDGGWGDRQRDISQALVIRESYQGYRLGSKDTTLIIRTSAVFVGAGGNSFFLADAKVAVYVVLGTGLTAF